MTTADRYQSNYSPAELIGEPYIKVHDGIRLECQKYFYRGKEMELCHSIEPDEVGLLNRLVPEPVIKKGDPGYEETLAYLNQFLIPREKAEDESAE